MKNDDVDVFCERRYLVGMTPEQCRAARAWLDLSQDDLATAANVSQSTIRDFEKGKRVPIAATLAAMKAALEQQGVKFFQGEQTLGIHYTQAPESN